jgi:hypothetical protein
VATPGISQQTATIIVACDLYANQADLDAFGAYSYDNGASGVGATITGGGNGQLVAGGTPATVGQRIVASGTNMYGTVPENGIYVVTAAGNGSTPYILTRATDVNTAATLGAFSATRLGGSRTVYLIPESSPFVVGTSKLSLAIESLDSHAEGSATATGLFSHAEGSATASGDYAHAEGSSVASGSGGHAEGSSLASGASSHAEGNSYAAGSTSHAEALGQATGDYSHAEAFSAASGLLSHAEGTSRAYMTGMYAHSAGAISNQTQYSRVVRSQTSVSANPVDINDYQNQPALVFPDFFRCALLIVHVVARRHDGTSVASAWRAECLVEGNGSSSFRFIGSPAFTLIGQDAGASTWSVADLAFNPSDHHQMLITVTGEADVPIYWHATIELHEAS